MFIIYLFLVVVFMFLSVISFLSTNNIISGSKILSKIDVFIVSFFFLFSSIVFWQSFLNCFKEFN